MVSAHLGDLLKHLLLINAESYGVGVCAVGATRRLQIRRLRIRVSHWIVTHCWKIHTLKSLIKVYIRHLILYHVRRFWYRTCRYLLCSSFSSTGATVVHEQKHLRPLVREKLFHFGDKRLDSISVGLKYAVSLKWKSWRSCLWRVSFLKQGKCGRKTLPVLSVE